MSFTATTISDVSPARKGESCGFRSVLGTNAAGDNENMRSVWTELAKCKFAKVFSSRNGDKMKVTIAPTKDMQTAARKMDATLAEKVTNERFPYKAILTEHDKYGTSMEVVAYEGRVSVYDAREGDPVKVPGTLEQHTALLKGKYLKIKCDMSTMTQYSANGGASKLLIKARVVIIEPEPEEDDEGEDDLAGYTPTRKRDREEPCMSPPNKRACA